MAENDARYLTIPLPDDFPDGSYTLYTGLYDPITLERVQVRDSSQTPIVNNAIVLGRVQVQ